MEKKRLTVHGNEVTDGRFAWVTPEKDIELLRKGIQAGFKSLAYGNEPYGCVLAGGPCQGGRGGAGPPAGGHVSHTGLGRRELPRAHRRADLKGELL